MGTVMDFTERYLELLMNLPEVMGLGVGMTEAQIAWFQSHIPFP